MARKMIRIIIFIIGILGFMWFLAPLVTYGIINIGNATGIIVFACIGIYGIKMSYINQLIAKIWNSLKGKVLLSVIGACGAIVIMLLSS